MEGSIAIGVVGDRDASRSSHAATDEALRHAAAALGATLETTWLPTAGLREGVERALGRFSGLFVAPGGPYRSPEGALRAIRWAREGGVPLLGTCGGFQHVALEYARNVLGVEGARHAEYGPGKGPLVIEPLECSLAGRRAAVHLAPGSRAAAVYAAARVTEEYRCAFGIASRWEAALDEAGLAIAGRDDAGEPRVLELGGHPFFVASLFVPQLSSAPDRPHPLLAAFVAASVGAPSAA